MWYGAIAAFSLNSAATSEMEGGDSPVKTLNARSSRRSSSPCGPVSHARMMALRLSSIDLAISAEFNIQES
jgi:hypothetical protein